MEELDRFWPQLCPAPPGWTEPLTLSQTWWWPSRQHVEERLNPDHWNWLDVVFCSQFVFIIRRVLLGHLNREYLRETDRERDTGVSRPTCWFYYSQIQLHHNKQDSNRKLKCFCRGQQEKSDRASEVSSPDESCSVEHEATKVQLPGWKMTRRVSTVETCTGLLVSRAG